MNIFRFTLLLLIACGNNTTYPMILAHKQEHSRKKNVPCIKEENCTFKKPISVCIHPHVESQNIMTTLGALPVALAQKKAHELTPEYFSYYFEQQYDNQNNSNQNEMLKILSLPVEVVHPICFHLCNQDLHMFHTFCQQPLGKALEWLALTKEKYEKDKKLKNLISFPKFYVFSKEMIIELANTTRYFAENTRDYPISLYQEKILACLPLALKNDPYFHSKTFENRIRGCYKSIKLDQKKATLANVITIMVTALIGCPSAYLTKGYTLIDAFKIVFKEDLYTIIPISTLAQNLVAPFIIYYLKSEVEQRPYKQSTINELGTW